MFFYNIPEQTPTIRQIALKTLFEYFNADPSGQQAFALGWYSEAYPILDLEVNLLGLSLTDEEETEDV